MEDLMPARFPSRNTLKRQRREARHQEWLEQNPPAPPDTDELLLQLAIDLLRRHIDPTTLSDEDLEIHRRLMEST